MNLTQQLTLSLIPESGNTPALMVEVALNGDMMRPFTVHWRNHAEPEEFSLIELSNLVDLIGAAMEKYMLITTTAKQAIEDVEGEEPPMPTDEELAAMEEEACIIIEESEGIVDGCHA